MSVVEAPPPPAEMLTVATTAPPPTVRPEKPERNLWRGQEMLTVLQIIRDFNYLELLNDKTVRSETVFRNIEKEMHDRGLRKKNYQQIWTKWKFLKSTYMTSRRIHQVPKIIPLDVYESLDELLSAEFRNGGEGSVSSYDGGDCDDGGGMGSYEMTNASGGSNDGGLLVISSVQGGVPYGGGGRHFNGFNGGLVKRKIKNGFRALKHEEDINGFGMQHPIFGYRLGVVKDEPIDDEYGNSATAEEPYSDVQLDEQCLAQFPATVKPEPTSPPHPTAPEPIQPPVPLMHMPPLRDMSSCRTSFPPINFGPSSKDSSMPPLHRYTPPPFPLAQQQEFPLLPPPPLKEVPLVKITLPSKPQVPQTSPIKRPAPSVIAANSKKIPVLTIRKRKKRLNIPQLPDGPNSPAPSSKHSKLSEEEDSKEESKEPTTSSHIPRIPFVTYSKAMREMSISLREIQREMIDEFFKQQMDLAKSEHEFQKQQDALLLSCFEDQTRLLLDGAKKLFQTGMPPMEDGLGVPQQ